MKKINIIITFVLAIVLFGCATYEPQYASNNSYKSNLPSDKDIDHRFFLIGDVGFSATGKIPS